MDEAKKDLLECYECTHGHKYVQFKSVYPDTQTQTHTHTHTGKSGGWLIAASLSPWKFVMTLLVKKHSGGNQRVIEWRRKIKSSSHLSLFSS